MTELNVVKRLREIQRKIEELSKKQVVVGAIDSSTREDGLTNADLLAIHEFGSRRNNIPERPVLRSTLTNSKDIIGNALSKKVAECLSGGLDVDDAYSHVGIFVRSEVLKTFDKNDFTPNDPKTIARKGSSKPLIDTGALRASISYEVRNRE